MACPLNLPAFATGQAKYWKKKGFLLILLEEGTELRRLPLARICWTSRIVGTSGNVVCMTLDSILPRTDIGMNYTSFKSVSPSNNAVARHVIIALVLLSAAFC